MTAEDQGDSHYGLSLLIKGNRQEDGKKWKSDMVNPFDHNEHRRALRASTDSLMKIIAKYIQIISNTGTRGWILPGLKAL